MITDKSVDGALMFLALNVEKAAKARADKVMAEEGRKVKKALLMQQSNESNVNAQERHAYASPEYDKYLKETLGPAIYDDHFYELKRKSAEATIDAWRTQEASHRASGKIG
jgi:hypothetical protein